MSHGTNILNNFELSITCPLFLYILLYLNKIQQALYFLLYDAGNLKYMHNSANTPNAYG